MNNIDIKSILSELYSVDPDLKSREKEIIAILHSLAIKPQATYDAAFAAELRTHLLTELATPRVAEKQNSIFTFFASKNIRYSAAGLLALVLIGTVAISITAKKKIGGGGASVALLPSGVTITHVGNDAFGSLSGATSVTTDNVAANGTAQGNTKPTGQSAAAKIGSSPIVAAPMNAMAIPIRPITPPIYSNPTIMYAYTGAPLTQNQTQLDVLKKIATSLDATQANTALAQMEFGQVDLSTFTNLGVSNVTLSQNQSFGYQMYIDLAGGTISFNQNYDTWPQSTTTPLTASEIPSDDDVIAIANQFFADHHISLSSYGTPTVTKMQSYAVPLAAGTASMPMIPYYSDSEQVLYPLIVNGMNVYNESGEAIGITVEVNLRYRRVASVSGIETQSYQASAYNAITDTSTILGMAENSRSYPIIYNQAISGDAVGASGDGSDVTTLDLGTPSMAYREAYQTDTNGTSNEFLVPAFVFPVTGSGTTADQEIVVPLIQDFVQKNLQIRPIPLGVSAPSATTSFSAHAPSPQ